MPCDQENPRGLCRMVISVRLPGAFLTFLSHGSERAEDREIVRPRACQTNNTFLVLLAARHNTRRKTAVWANGTVYHCDTSYTTFTHIAGKFKQRISTLFNVIEFSIENKTATTISSSEKRFSLHAKLKWGYFFLFSKISIGFTNTLSPYFESTQQGSRSSESGQYRNSFRIITIADPIAHDSN